MSCSGATVYATSSNRVIAELEALPPGTMQMLSTNHLGQACQE